MQVDVYFLYKLVDIAECAQMLRQSRWFAYRHAIAYYGLEQVTVAKCNYYRTDQEHDW